MSLRTVPLTLKQANDFVSMHHRHHRRAVGHRFSIGAVKGGELVGCAIVGRPVARKTDQNLVAEVVRLCTDGTKNACSILYAASARAARAMGYSSIQTFTMDSEGGASLRASGWTRGHETPGRSWAVPSRDREDSHPLGTKRHWHKILNEDIDWIAPELVIDNQPTLFACDIEGGGE